MTLLTLRHLPELDRLTAAQRAALAEARAELAAGLAVPGDEVDAWIDSWGTENELPTPTPRPLGHLLSE
jgi:predicted transcriptional regulator